MFGSQVGLGVLTTKVFAEKRPPGALGSPRIDSQKLPQKQHHCILDGQASLQPCMSVCLSASTIAFVSMNRITQLQNISHRTFPSTHACVAASAQTCGLTSELATNCARPADFFCVWVLVHMQPCPHLCLATSSSFLATEPRQVCQDTLDVLKASQKQTVFTHLPPRHSSGSLSVFQALQRHSSVFSGALLLLLTADPAHV